MKKITTRALVTTAMLSAIAALLMFLDFPVPFMPPFIKMDVSELPALIASFALGPVYGVIVCLLKNLINLLRTTTGGVGELANFLLGASFVLPAGLIYKKSKTKKSALWSCIIGSVVMAVLSVPINYFITYPIYTKFMPLEAIIGAYEEIFSGVNGLLSCLLIFNMPFTLLKGILTSAITFVIYKRISKIIKG